MNKPIPFFDLMQQYAALKPEMDAAVARVLSKGHYILGEEVESFEKRFAALCGAQYGIGANSGTTALMLDCSRWASVPATRSSPWPIPSSRPPKRSR